MPPFVGDALSEDELRALCTQAYGRFAHDAVTPLVQLDEQHWLLELFHGPTLAFKDVALQLLGLLFEHFLTGTDQHADRRRRDQRRYRIGGDRRAGGARAGSRSSCSTPRAACPTCSAAR